MARVAVAYVEVRPDLKGFGTLLKAELSALGKQSIKLDADTKGVEAATAKVRNLTKKQAADVEKIEEGKFTRLSQIAVAQSKKMATDQRRWEKDNFKGLSQLAIAQVNKMAKDRLKADADERKAFLARSKQHVQRVFAEDTRLFFEQEKAAKESGRKISQLALANVQKLMKDRVKAEKNAMGQISQLALANVQKLMKDREKVESDAAKARLARAKARGQAAFAEDRRIFLAREKFIRDWYKRAERDATRAGARSGNSFAERFGTFLQSRIKVPIGRLGFIFGAIAATAAPLAGILSSVAAGVVSVGSAALYAAGALGVSLVSGLLAAGQAMGVVAFASKGVGDSLKALDNIQTKVAAGVEITKGDMDNYREAMAKLSPAAREVVGALGAVHGQFATIRKTVSQALFAGVGAQIKVLASRYLPMLNSQFAGMGGMLNTAGKEFATFAGKASTIDRVRKIMAGNTSIVKVFMKALVPLADVALTLVKAFQPLGMMLAQYVSRWAKAKQQTTGAAAASGRLATTVTTLKTVMALFLRITANIGKALKGTFKASLGPGMVLAQMFERLTARWAAWANSVEGSSAIRKWGLSAIPILQSLGRLIGDAFRMFNRLAKAGGASSFVDSLRQILPPLEALLIQLSASGAIDGFATSIAKLLTLLSQLGAGGILSQAVDIASTMVRVIVDLAQATPGLSTAIGTLVGVMTALAAIRIAATITGLSRLPGLTVGIINFTKALWGAALAEGAAATGAAKFGTWLRTTGRGVINFTKALLGMELAGSAATVGAGRLGTAIRNVGTVMKVAFMWTMRQAGAALAAAGAWIAETAATVAATAAQWALNVAMYANPIGLFVLAIVIMIAQIAGMIYVLTMLYKKFTFVRTAVDGVVNGFKLYIETASRVWKWLIKIVGAAAKFAYEWTGLSAVVEKVRVVIDAVVKAIKTALASLPGWARKMFGGVDDAQKKTASTAQTSGRAVSKAWEDASSLTNASLQEMMDMHDRVAAHSVDTTQKWVKTNSDLIAQAAKVNSLAAAAFNPNSTEAEMQRYERAVGDLMALTNKPISFGTGPKAKKKKPVPETPIADQFLGAIDTGQAQLLAAAKKAGKKTAAGYLSTLVPALAKLDPFQFIKKRLAYGYKTGKSMAEYIAKGITSGAKNIGKVTRYIQKHYGKTLTAMIAKNQKFYSTAKGIAKAIPEFKGKKFTSGAALDAYLGGKQDYWQRRLDQIKDFKADVISTLTQGRNLTGYFGFIPTPAEVRAKLDAQLAQIKQFSADIAALQKQGLSKELAREWLAAGPEAAGNMVTGLKDASKTELVGISNQFAAIGTEATRIANSAGNAYFSVGQKTVEGYIAGIASMRTIASKEMSGLITYVLKAVKKKLGIKSPSTVFAGLGTNTMAGYVQGVAGMRNDTVASVSKIYDAMTSARPAVLPMPSVGRPGFAGPGALGGITEPQAPAFDVRVFVGDRELTDIVDTRITRMDSTRARALLAGRRGG